MLPDELFGGIPCEGKDAGAGELDDPANIGGIDNPTEIVDQFAVIGLG